MKNTLSQSQQCPRRPVAEKKNSQYVLLYTTCAGVRMQSPLALNGSTSKRRFPQDLRRGQNRITYDAIDWLKIGGDEGPACVSASPFAPAA